MVKLSSETEQVYRRLPFEAPFRMSSDADAVKSLLESFCSDLTGTVFPSNAIPGALFIRPSGNPLKAEDFTAFVNGDVVMQEMGMVKLHKLEVGTEMAWATMTQKAKFSYKGTPNDDPSFTVSAFLQKVGGKWKFAHLQRSSSPSDLGTWP